MIDDALNEVIATLGFNDYPVLLLIVSSAFIVLAATVPYFVGPLVMSLGVLVASLPSSCCD